MKEIVANFAINHAIDQMGSILDGRRNWIIITYDNSIFWNGGFGEANRRGLLNWRLVDIAKHHVHFFEYTYKKDYRKALEILQKEFSKES